MDIASVSPSLLLHAYASGVFPMAESRDDPEIFWVEPEERGILPFPRFHISRSLRKTMRSDRFEVVVDRDFRAVMQQCAASYTGRENTWISTGIEELYCELHALGYAHSVECYRHGNLVGGLYGVSLAGAFFGESMFHLETDASKVALTHLVAHLIAKGYNLLDVQFQTDHLRQFGVLEIPMADYRKLLEEALGNEASLDAAVSLSGQAALDLIDQYQSGALQVTTHTS